MLKPQLTFEWNLTEVLGFATKLAGETIIKKLFPWRACELQLDSSLSLAWKSYDSRDCPSSYAVSVSDHAKVTRWKVKKQGE